MEYYIWKAEENELKTLNQVMSDYNIQLAPELPRVELIYTYDQHREKGVASMLLDHVEKTAQAHTCSLAHLDTLDFQAKDFYLKQEYRIFGVLEHAPKGRKRYYMNKDL